MPFGTLNENEGVRRLLQQPNFNCDGYLRSVVSSGDFEISKSINLLTQWSENTSSELKKAIYENCDLFVDAGKAICHLETNMHFINHDLIEQKRLLNELNELKLVSENKTEVSNMNLMSDDSGNEYLSILEKIEGVSHLLKPECNVIFLSDLNELNSQNFTVQSSVKLILLSDLLLIAKKYPHSPTEMGYRLVCSYELSNVAVVNVSERDCAAAANVFKVIAFPDIRFFKAESSRLKVDWIQHIEDQLQHRHVSNRMKKNNECMPQNASINDYSASQVTFTMPDWLVELPDDLDVVIAERDLETAVQLVERSREYLEKNQNDLSERTRSDLAAKVKSRALTLTEMLTDELASGSGRRGGLRSVRGAISLLNRLGKRGFACELFLTNRSAMLDQRASQVAREGSQALYATRRSFAFHRGILETCLEFQSIMEKFRSKLFFWCNSEMRKFAEDLRILLVESRAVPFLTLCSIMYPVRMHARAVGDKVGANLEAAFEAGLMDCWEKLAREHAKVLRDALDHRASDEEWKRKELSGIKDKEAFIQEMTEAGIDIRGFIEETKARFTVTLTGSTCILARSLCLFAEGLRRLGCCQLSVIFQDLLADLLSAELRHYYGCLRSHKSKEKQQFILENLMFMSITVIPKLEKSLSFLEEIGAESKFSRSTNEYKKCLSNYQSMKV